MNPILERTQAITRRHFLKDCRTGLGALALASLLADGARGAVPSVENPMAVRPPHFAPKAKRVIFLDMVGGPSQHDLFDHKPKLNEMHLQPCPDELLKNQRFAFIKGHPKLLGTPYKFAKHGECGAEVSELLPHIAKVVDDVTFIKSMTTDQFNHAPAELLLFTGSPRFGGASMGSWITYGLGSESQNLPGFVVLVSGGRDPVGGNSTWGSGFLPSVFQGVQCRTTGDPILFANNPEGMDATVRRRSLDALKKLNELEFEKVGDPETQARISQYELAYRMQMSVPEVMDVSKETQATLDMYGVEPGKPSFAKNCLLARRLIEQGVRYLQLFDWGWDTHGVGSGDDLITALPNKCKDVDQAVAALITDLKQRGLLDDTLVVWGGEFGRTSMNEARGGSKFLGRDHHPHCFTMFMAGGGTKPGMTLGATDDFGYFVTEDKVTVRDLQATILHLLGLDPWKLTYSFQGLQQRLIGPEGDAKIIEKIIA